MNISKDEGIKLLNGGAMVKSSCSTCKKPLDEDGRDLDQMRCFGCLKKANAAAASGDKSYELGRPTSCAICRLPVRGTYVWCQGCGHGGHFDHMSQWFSTQSLCPTGCMHNCQFDDMVRTVQPEPRSRGSGKTRRCGSDAAAAAPAGPFASFDVVCCGADLADVQSQAELGARNRGDQYSTSTSHDLF